MKISDPVTNIELLKWAHQISANKLKMG